MDEAHDFNRGFLDFLYGNEAHDFNRGFLGFIAVFGFFVRK